MKKNVSLSRVTALDGVALDYLAPKKIPKKAA